MAKPRTSVAERGGNVGRRPISYWCDSCSGATQEAPQAPYATAPLRCRSQRSLTCCLCPDACAFPLPQPSGPPLTYGGAGSWSSAVSGRQRHRCGKGRRFPSATHTHRTITPTAMEPHPDADTRQYMHLMFHAVACSPIRLYAWPIFTPSCAFQVSAWYAANAKDVWDDNNRPSFNVRPAGRAHMHGRGKLARWPVRSCLYPVCALRRLGCTPSACAPRMLCAITSAATALRAVWVSSCSCMYAWTRAHRCPTPTRPACRLPGS
jgi:hypothetical protein